MSGGLRILYHHRTQGRGAEGNHIVSIVTALRQLGHHVDVLSPPGVDPFDPAASVPVDKASTTTSGWSSVWKFISRHVPGVLFEAGEIAYNIAAWRRLRRVLHHGRYDVVYERYAFFMLAGAVAARAAGCRFILEVNEVSGIPNRARRQAFVRLCSWFERKLLRRCDLVHAVSSYLAQGAARQGAAPERIVVAPNGFAVSRIATLRSRQEMRDRLAIRDRIVIGFAGWFDHWDRLDFLVSVFADLRRLRPTVLLCLVGDGPAGDEARKQIAAAGLQDAVLMTGAVPRSDVYDYLQVFDIGVLPHSNMFGSPIVMFEMMGLRIPLVLPALPPIADVHVTGRTALLFAPLDHDQCLAALLRLVDAPAERQGLADCAYQKLVAEHSWQDTARRIMSALPATH